MSRTRLKGACGQRIVMLCVCLKIVVMMSVDSHTMIKS